MVWSEYHGQPHTRQIVWNGDFIVDDHMILYLWTYCPWGFKGRMVIV
jgi:hypothetical protein